MMTKREMQALSSNELLKIQAQYQAKADENKAKLSDIFALTSYQAMELRDENQNVLHTVALIDRVLFEREKRGKS